MAFLHEIHVCVYAGMENVTTVCMDEDENTKMMEVGTEVHITTDGQFVRLPGCFGAKLGLPLVESLAL